MFKLRNFKFFIPAFLIAAGTAGANTIIDSSATETTNNSGDATVNIIHPALFWGAAQTGSDWVSYVQSGDPASPGYVQVPVGTFVRFGDTFTAGAGATGFVNVLGDDIIKIIFNGHILDTQSPSTTLCTSLPIGCVDAFHVDLTPDMVVGINKLAFIVGEVSQIGDGGSNGPVANWDHPGPFGLNYSGVISDAPAVPESSTWALMSLPLLAFGLLRKKIAQRFSA